MIQIYGIQSIQFENIQDVRCLQDIKFWAQIKNVISVELSNKDQYTLYKNGNFPRSPGSQRQERQTHDPSFSLREVLVVMVG